MDDRQLYELLGRKQAELEELHGEYDRLLAVLADVVSGDIAPARVCVDRQARRWEVLPVMDAIVSVAPLVNGHVQSIPVEARKEE